MATYNVIKTNGEVYTTLTESELDTSTGLNLIGQNFRNYGELIASNFFRLTENFANVTPPNQPVEGQLWWDTSTKILNFYDGSRFKSVTGNSTQDTEPLAPSIGDNWWDTRTDQLKVFTGTGWVVVGPLYEKQQGITGIFPTTVVDTQTNVHVVSLLKVNNIVVAIISNDEPFTPVSFIAGISTVQRGVNVISNGTLNGTAFNALRLGNTEASKFVNTDSSGTTLNGNLTLSGTRRLTVGGLELQTEGSGEKVITATGSNNLLLKTASGTVTLLSTGELQCNTQPTTSTGVANKGYVDDKIGSTLSAVSSGILPSISNTFDLGSVDKRWARVYGTATAVVAGDLAERYIADSSYSPGTVVVFGGAEEVTVTDVYADTRVAGVVSTDPGYLMGDTGTGLPIALTGKVPCRVTGKVNKGDVLVTSTIPGVAIALSHPAQWKPGCVIGKSLESSSVQDVKTINVVVGRF